MPAQWGSSSVISSARRRRRPGTCVGAAAALELVQARELALVQRDDDLAAALDGDAALLAVVVQARGALDAQARLQRARLVVDAGVDDPGVVAGLARCPPRRRRRPRPRAAPDGARAARARWPGRRCPPRRWRGRSAPRAARVVVASARGGRSLVCRAGARHRSQRRHRRRARPPPGAGRPRRARLRPRPVARHRGGRRAEVVRGDAVSGAGLDEALDGVDVAYFLIHSMETALNGAGTLRRPRPRGRARASPTRRAPRACAASSTSAAWCPPTRRPRRTWPAASRSSGRCWAPPPRRSRCAPRSSSRPARARSASSCASSSACRSCRCRRGATTARGPSTGAT